MFNSERASEEAFQAFVGAQAERIVHAAYLGLLGREAGGEELQRHAARLAQTHDLTALLAEIAGSEECWRNQMKAHAPELVNAMYRGILKREADSSGLATYVKFLDKPDGISGVMESLILSEEFARLHPAPAAAALQQPVVFLHIQKTAGTSLQNMLRERFGAAAYLEHADTLAKRSATELAAYSVFAGHFNYDSLGHIPKKPLQIFTFVREPKALLLSLYFFLCAHESTAPTWDEKMKLANEHNIEAFFELDQIKSSSGFRDHMTWAVMGDRLWRQWQTLLMETPDSGRKRELMETVIRPAIRARLREFAFVGLQEDFDRSVDILCRILGWPPFALVRKDNSLEKNIQENPHFKNRVEKQPLTPQVEALLAQLVQLDTILYEEAKALYAERLEKYLPGAPIVAGSSRTKEAADFTATDLTAEKIVFLHIPKTGGTTLHHLLLPHFAEEFVCPERFNGLRHYPAGKLARYRLFSGHFDLPSVQLIPGPKKIVTLLREPVSRLVSLYHFARAHRPEIIERDGLELHRLANKYSMADFFRAKEVRNHPAINNAMTRVLSQAIGGTRWEAQASIPDTGDTLSVDDALYALKSLTAFGIMERYAESVALIFKALNLPRPAAIVPRQVLDVIVEEEPGLRRIEKEPVTDEIRTLTVELVEADTELYRKAAEIFERRWSRERS